jgi:Ser/Thr protein kinase RdoA (MazF antagonist)
MTYRERRNSAIHAAVTVAARLGMASAAPVILRDSNHTSIHLVPFPVVARVARWSVGSGATEKLSAELSVAEYLARRGAPITTPTVDVPPGPHLEGDWAMTLWQFVAHRPAKDSDALVAAKSLREVHGALASYPGQLPSFDVAVDACLCRLQQEAGLPDLATADKDFLVTEHNRLRQLLAEAAITPVAIHGDPHLGNVLMTSSGPLWTDWESACVGPLEWDLSCLPEATLAVVPAVNAKLLAVLRDLRSVCVAVWCWAEPDRAPEKREAAEYHLHRLRERSRVARPT